MKSPLQVRPTIVSLGFEPAFNSNPSSFTALSEIIRCHLQLGFRAEKNLKCFPAKDQSCCKILSMFFLNKFLLFLLWTFVDSSGTSLKKSLQLLNTALLHFSQYRDLHSSLKSCAVFRYAGYALNLKLKKTNKDFFFSNWKFLSMKQKKR